MHSQTCAKGMCITQYIRSFISSNSYRFPRIIFLNSCKLRIPNGMKKCETKNEKRRKRLPVYDKCCSMKRKLVLTNGPSMKYSRIDTRQLVRRTIFNQWVVCHPCGTIIQSTKASHWALQRLIFSIIIDFYNEKG